MSRKHHKSQYKSHKAKTVVNTNAVATVTPTKFTASDFIPKTTQKNQSYKKYAGNFTKYIYKPCHGITEIYQNFFLMKGSDEKDFIQKYNPDVIVPLAGTTNDIYALGFRGDVYYFPCPDYGTLPDEILNKLVLKIVAGLTYGLKIGMYCIGGHGRTGYVAACVLGMLGIEDPIEHLWTKYCDKAIESKEQLKAISTYLNKPELYNKYQSKIHDFLWGVGAYSGASIYGGWSDWGYSGGWSTSKSPKTSITPSTSFYPSYGWGLEDEESDSSIIDTHFSSQTYLDDLIARAAQEAVNDTDDDYEFVEVEDLDDLDETLAWRKAQEGRVLTPSEIKMLQDDPMWACSEMTLERLHGDELMEAFEYLKDVYGIG